MSKQLQTNEAVLDAKKHLDREHAEAEGGDKADKGPTAAELREDVRRYRESIASTLDEIEYKLDVRSRFAGVADRVRHDAVETYDRYPAVILGSAAAAVGAVIAGVWGALARRR